MRVGNGTGCGDGTIGAGVEAMGGRVTVSAGGDVGGGWVGGRVAVIATGVSVGAERVGVVTGGGGGVADGNGLAVGAGVLVGTRVGARVGRRTMGWRGVRMTRGVGVSVGSTTTVAGNTLRVGVTITIVGKTIGVFKTKGV